VRSVDVAQSDFAFEARIDGADLDPCHGPEGVLAIRFERFTAGNADLEHFGVVEHRPDTFPVGCDDDLATHVDGHDEVFRSAVPRAVEGQAAAAWTARRAITVTR